MISDVNSPILCVCAHPDDEVLGLGATANRLSKSGHDVYTIFISGKADQRYLGEKKDLLEYQSNKASEILCTNKPFFGDFPNLALHNIQSYKIVSFIEKYIVEVKPKTIFTHHASDLNIDHNIVSNLCLAASRLPQRRPDLKLPLIRNILFMEILSSTDWAFSNNLNGFIPNTFFEISKDNLRAKNNALNVYSKVRRPRPHPRNEETLQALATYRGSQCGANLAEAFQSCYTFYAN